MVATNCQVINEHFENGLLCFTLAGVKQREAQNLRKFLMDELPTMAIDIVDIYKNETLAGFWILKVVDDRASLKLAEWRKEMKADISEI